MSQYECVVPEIEWNLRQQRQEQVEGSEEKPIKGSERNHLHHQQHYNVLDNNNNTIRSSHVRPGLFQQNLHHHPTMSNNNVHQIAELTWENGQLSMHGHREPILAAAALPKPVWRSTDTLESIVHQASHNQSIINPQHMNQIGDHAENKLFFSSSSSGQKISHHAETSTAQTESILMMKKRTRSESEQCGTNNSNLFPNSSSYIKGDHRYHHQQGIDLSLCGSASATFCREEDTTMMTWASFESPRSLKAKKTADHDDSASLGISENQDEDCKTKTDHTGRSHSSSRRSRVAANHNQSERRRRDRINQKMRALQRLVPNAYKTDKASMLDEVIEYLKQLQAQVHTMMNMRNMNVPHFTMMPLGIAQAQQQQQLQLSLLSRMVGLGMGMGMLDPNSVARAAAAQAPPIMHPATTHAAATPTFVPPQFVVPPPPPAVVPVAQEKADAGNNALSAPMPDPFCAFLAQNMNNIDLYNKMAALYRQQQMGSPLTTHHQLGRDQQ